MSAVNPVQKRPLFEAEPVKFNGAADTEHYEPTVYVRGSAVVIKDIDVPFGSIIVLFLKMLPAAIVAALIITLAMTAGSVFLLAMVRP